MNESILSTIRSMLGPEEVYIHFDPVIIVHINSTLSELTRLGVGPASGFSIYDTEAKWEDLIGDRKDLNNIMTYIYLSVKLVFDPPTNAAVLSSMQAQINKLEWCIENAANE